MKIIQKLPSIADLYNLFLAIPLPKEACENFRELSNQVKSLDLPMTFQNSDTAHITLFFWKRIDDSLFDEICKTGDEMSKKFAPFDVSIEKVGYFPSQKQPRVMWLGVESKKTVESIAKELPWKDTRPFHAHCTLGRIKDFRPFLKKSKEIEDIFTDQKISFQADRLRLYGASGKKRQQELIDFPLVAQK